MGLSEEFWKVLDGDIENPEAGKKAYEMVVNAPDGPERDGLLGMIYYQGIGVEEDLEKAFEYAEKAAEKDEGIALYLLGIMCENAETPDQAEGGPRQKYDHYDAEQFMERCANTTSAWANDAHLWLGDFFFDGARGGDPDIAMEHYEVIGKYSREASAKLSDYYYDYASYEDFKNEELNKKALEWSEMAASWDPAGYAYQTGCMLAEGVGCKPSFRLARKYLEDAYYCGQWEAAETIANLFQERADSDEYPDEERERCRKDAESWHASAEKLRLSQTAEEPDNSIEED